MRFHNSNSFSAYIVFIGKMIIVSLQNADLLHLITTFDLQGRK